MKQVRGLIGGLAGPVLLMALILTLNSVFQSQVAQTGPAQAGVTPTSTPKSPLSFDSISIARRYALRVDGPVLEDNIYNQYSAPLFSPNGQMMLFHKPVPIEKAECKGWTCGFIAHELWRTDGQGRSPMLLARWVIGKAAWSPDSRQIAHVSRTPTGEGFLRVIRADGTDERLIASDVGGVKPEWLDSQTVVYMSREGRVIAFNLETRQSDRLDPPELKMNPNTGTFAVSAQGDRVILGVGPELWLMPLDTRKPISITPYYGAFGGGQGSIAWAPDGNRVAYASRSSIYLVDKNGKHLTEIGPKWDWFPWMLTWSPNGRWLACIGRTEDRGPYEIYLIDVEHRQVKQLTNDVKSVDTEIKNDLTWSPDGTKLIYGTRHAYGAIPSSEDKVQVIELTTDRSQIPEQTPRPFAQRRTVTATPTPPPLSDCPYQQGNNGTIWIFRERYGQGAVVNIPFERGVAGDPSLSNYLGGVLEMEIGGTAETPLADWQPEMARAFAIAARTVAAYWCPRTTIDDQGTRHRGLDDHTYQHYRPGWSPSRAAEYRGFVTDTEGQVLIYNGRLFDVQYRTYTGRQTTNRDPNGPHKGIFDPVAAADESSGTGLGQHSANHWAMGLHNERLGQPVNVPNLQWFDYRQILVHYYAGVHIRNATNNQLLTPEYRWNLLTESIPTTMVGGQSYPVPLVLQNTSTVDWEANRYVLGYRWDWGPEIYAAQTARVRMQVPIGQWVVTPIPTRVARGDPPYRPTLSIQPPDVSAEGDYILTIDVGRVQGNTYLWFGEQSNPDWWNFSKMVHVLPGATPTPPPPTPTPGITPTPTPEWPPLEQVALQGVDPHEQGQYAQLLSHVRDQVMRRSVGGQLYVDLTYRHAPELTAILLRNASLRQRAQVLLLRVRPGVEAWVSDKATPWVVEKDLVEQVDQFLKDLLVEASPGLAAEIRWWRQRLPQWMGKTPQQIWNELLQERRGLVTPSR